MDSGVSINHSEEGMLEHSSSHHGSQKGTGSRQLTGGNHSKI